MSSVQRPNDNPFAVDETLTVDMAGRPLLHLPVRLVLDGDNITLTEATDQPAAPPVLLVLFTEFLDDELVRELTERLAAVHDLRPAAITGDRHHTLEVPVVAPDVVTDDCVSWAITDTLALVHENRAEAYFTCPTRIPGQLALTAAQAWRLVQALVSLDGWQFWLQGRFAATATSARRALRRRLTPPRGIAAEPAKGAR